VGGPLSSGRFSLPPLTAEIFIPGIQPNAIHALARSFEASEILDLRASNSAFLKPIVQGAFPGVSAASIDPVTTGYPRPACQNICSSDCATFLFVLPPFEERDDHNETT
jgi:hypothetical protein